MFPKSLLPQLLLAGPQIWRGEFALHPVLFLHSVFRFRFPSKLDVANSRDLVSLHSATSFPLNKASEEPRPQDLLFGDDDAVICHCCSVKTSQPLAFSLFSSLCWLAKLVAGAAKKILLLRPQSH